MKKGPLFSVVTATYNRAHLLPRSVRSVLSQTCQDFELIIINDGSTDDTEAVCCSFNDDRIRYFRRSPNGGVLAARNKALDMAKGKYLAVLDDDDELRPEALETAVAEFERLSAKDVGIIWFNNVDFERWERSGWGPKDAEGDVLYEDLLCGRIGGDYWQVVRREIIGPEDRYDERLWCGEILWWLGLHRKCRAYYVPKVLLVCHREHGGERLSNLQNMLNHLPQLILTNKALIDEYGDEQKRLCPKAYGRRLGILGAYQIMNGQKKDGRTVCRESFRYHRSFLCTTVFLLSFLLAGGQIRYLASVSIKVLRTLGLERVLK